ncbi:homocysteine S-methyltransferase family protein [Gymnodinialimonas sp.]
MTLLPDSPDLFLAYAGMETDLIFTHGMELPGFASYPLMETIKGQRLLQSYFTAMIDLGREAGTGVILESPTWVAHRDRGAAIGYAAERLGALNAAAVGLMKEVREGAAGVPVVLSANIGPRADAYAPTEQMSVAEAEAYHLEQVSALRGVDVISGYTLTYAAEAAGIARAAKACGLPVVIAFTVELDGCLPTGMSVADAIAEVDAQTGAYPAYYMINCAHPDHFEGVLDGGAWMNRLGGLVANASRCSHAELDEAEVLDDGNPEELGQQLAGLRARFPQIRVLGGCCGTDMRHMRAIAAS